MKRKIIHFLLFLGFIFPTLYLVSITVFNYPIVFGDEGYHMSIVRYIAEKKEIPIYLKDLFGTDLSFSGFAYNPFFHFLFGFFYSIGKEFACKLLLVFIFFLCSFSLFVLTYKVLNFEAALISSITFSNLQAVILYSTTFYVDMLMNFFFIVSFFFFILSLRENNKKYLIYSAVSAALAVFTKYYALFYSIFLFIYSIYFLIKREKEKFLSSFFIFISSFFLVAMFAIRNVILFNSPCIPIGVQAIENIVSSVFKNQKCSVSEYQSQYQFAGRTEKVSSEQDVVSFGILNFLRFFLWGNENLDYLFIFLFFLGIILLIKEDITIPIFLFSVFLVLLIQTLQGNLLTTGFFYRAEDTARQLLLLTPIFSFVVSYPISKFEKLKKYLKDNYQIAFFTISLIFLIVLFKLSSSQKIEIMKSVKSFSSYFFDACDWVKENLPKNSTLMSLWGYRVAYNCERRVGGDSDLRLSNNATFIKEVAEKLGIKYFFIEKFSIDPLNRKFSEMYDLEWVELINKNFEKVFENGIPIDTCISRLEKFKQYGIGRSDCDGVVIYKIYE